jgi:adenosine deaminase
MFKLKAHILVLLSVALFSCNNKPENISEYFENIKDDPLELREFFNNMPKGGDIHHHALGAVSAKELLSYAITDSLYINPKTGQLKEKALVQDTAAFVLIHHYLALPGSQNAIIQEWTVKDYVKLKKDGREQFFSTFAKFRPAFVGNEARMLSSLCQKATEENVSYLETQIAVKSVQDEVYKLNEVLIPQIELGDSNSLRKALNFAHKTNILHWVEKNVEAINQIYSETKKGNTALKFQTYVVRVIPNDYAVFKQLIVAFETARRSPHVVGVNFVAPEDHEVALRKYPLHMEMFRFLHQVYPEVKIALHAGELAENIGDVTPKDMTFHIRDAVQVGMASRIGHGVDITYEKNSDSLLAMLKKRGIAIEINLESNEVILQQDPSTHPIKKIKEAGIPICIGSDDEGVLRTNLANQYVLLVKYLPEITYDEVKSFSKNAIQYSFLAESEKETLLNDLQLKFKLFEEITLKSQ